MVVAEGMGDEHCQASGAEKSHRRTGTTSGVGPLRERSTLVATKFEAAPFTGPLSKGCVGRCRLYSSNRRVLLELRGVACVSFRIEVVGSESPLQSRSEEDVFAEVAATNMAIVKATARVGRHRQTTVSFPDSGGRPFRH
jgi:hypothetical protein